MLCLRREAAETPEDYMRRANSKVKSLKLRHGMRGWDWLHHRSVYAWGRHVARIRSYDSGRLSYALLDFKKWKWVCRTALMNGGNQLHGRRLHVWRCERALYKYHMDEDWQDIAQNHATWNSQLDVMASWRVAEC